MDALLTHLGRNRLNKLGLGTKSFKNYQIVDGRVVLFEVVAKKMVGDPLKKFVKHSPFENTSI